MIQVDTQMDLRLAEQNHRIANMFQLVASLLGRHAASATNTVAANILRAADAQIRAFALLNQALLGQDEGVACGATYLRALCGHLRAACLAPRGLGLALHLPAGAPMDCQNAQAMGLLVVEAVTNAVKHAFPDERSGLITISLTTVPACGHLVCTVSDDGMGMKDARPAPGSGQGVAFMRALAERLGGTLLMGDGGAGSSVSFQVRPCEGWPDTPALTVRPELASQQPPASSNPLELHHGQA